MSHRPAAASGQRRATRGSRLLGLRQEPYKSGQRPVGHDHGLSAIGPSAGRRAAAWPRLTSAMYMAQTPHGSCNGIARPGGWVTSRRLRLIYEAPAERSVRRASRGRGPRTARPSLAPGGPLGPREELRAQRRPAVVTDLGRLPHEVGLWRSLLIFLEIIAFC